MHIDEIQTYLGEHIPLTQAMGLSVRVASGEKVVVSAPLEPNVNHRQTAFGGSISALATVAAWSWLHLDAQRLGFPVRLVIRSNQVQYLQPVESEFTAICEAPPSRSLDDYHDGLRRKGRARIELSSTVHCEGQLCATFVGVFVAIRNDGP